MNESSPIDVALIQSKHIFENGDFDGCYFRQIVEPEKNWVDFKFIKFKTETQFHISPDTGFSEYIIIMFERKKENEKDDLAYYHAYFGDPLPFIKGQASSGNEGLIVKTSTYGYIMARTIMKNIPLEDIKNRIEFDLTNFKLCYGMTNIEDL